MKWFVLMFLIGLVGLVTIGLHIHWSVVGLPATLAKWATVGFVGSSVLMEIGAGGIAGIAGYDFYP